MTAHRRQQIETAMDRAVARARKAAQAPERLTVLPLTPEDVVQRTVHWRQMRWMTGN